MEAKSILSACAPAKDIPGISAAIFAAITSAVETMSRAGIDAGRALERERKRIAASGHVAIFDGETIVEGYDDRKRAIRHATGGATVDAPALIYGRPALRAFLAKERKSLEEKLRGAYVEGRRLNRAERRFAARQLRLA